MINFNSQLEHLYNTPKHSCRECYKWELCPLGKNRPTSLKGDYGLYGCIDHQENKYNKEKYE